MTTKETTKKKRTPRAHKPKGYTFADLVKVGQLWRKYFPFPLNGIYDCTLSAIMLAPKIDLAALDECLLSAHPEDADKLSIRDVIAKHYGEDAAKFIEKLL